MSPYVLRGCKNTSSTRRRQVPGIFSNTSFDNTRRGRSRPVQRHGHTSHTTNTQHGHRNDHLRVDNQLLVRKRKISHVTER